MYTYNQIVQRLLQFGQDHRQINSQYYGYVGEILSEKDIRYPILVCSPMPKSVGEEDTFNFQITIADLLRDYDSGVGIGNELEIQSDTEQICKDLLKFFEKNLTDLKISTPVTLASFGAKNTGHSVGWTMDITLTQYNDHDYCSIPIDDESVPANRQYVSIKNVETGVEIATRYPGQDYYVLQFSGIQDSGAPYTNTIVDTE